MVCSKRNMATIQATMQMTILKQMNKIASNSLRVFFIPIDRLPFFVRNISGENHIKMNRTGTKL